MMSEVSLQRLVDKLDSVIEPCKSVPIADYDADPRESERFLTDQREFIEQFQLWNANFSGPKLLEEAASLCQQNELPSDASKLRELRQNIIEQLDIIWVHDAAVRAVSGDELAQSIIALPEFRDYPRPLGIEELDVDTQCERFGILAAEIVQVGEYTQELQKSVATVLEKSLRLAGAEKQLAPQTDRGDAIPGGDNPGEKPPSKRPQRIWLAEALLTLREYPDWSASKIADEVGVHRSTLSRSNEFQAAYELAKGDPGRTPSGNAIVDRETGARRGIEAAAPPMQDCNDKPDRGQQIPGSRYCQEYCAECGESIRVLKNRVGRSPRCDKCKG